MIFLIRHKNSGTDIHSDAKMSSRVITLGRGLDQHVQLMGAGISKSHVIIRAEKNKLRGSVQVVVLAAKRITVNGQQVFKKILQPGDEFSLSGHRIKIIAPPEGFDVACEIVIDEQQKHDEWIASRRTEFVAQIWTPRRLAYGFSVIVFALAFLWPYSDYRSFVDSNSADNPTADLVQPMTLVIENSFGGASLWSPGPLASAHNNAIGDDCNTCHTKAFQAVQDEACITCHQQIVQHFAPDPGSRTLTSESHSVGSAVERLACENCHKEHNQPESIVSTVDELCTQCHRGNVIDSHGLVRQTATSFSASQHPEFRYSLLVGSADTENTGNNIIWEKARLEANALAIEDSHLNFSHELHLQLDEPNLMCSNCHQLSENNEHFEAITMETHCSDCHELSFDGRSIPHGNAALAIRSIEEYFIALYVSPDREIESPLRRLPGRRVRACEGTDYECALVHAEEEIKLQFNNSGCITCHQVSETRQSIIGNTQSTDFDQEISGWSPLSQLWAVEGVKINADWYEGARFDHARHLTQRGQSQNQQCGSCHEAATSKLSADILIPKSENCYQCHDNSSQNNSIDMNCVDCHSHHASDRKRFLRAAINEP